MSNKKTKTDPRVLRTRALLMDALMDLIPEKGYDAITVKDIAERATLNRATFYLHYRNKDDLLYQGMRAVLDELNPKHPFQNRDSGEYTYESTRETIRADFEHVQKHIAFYEVMLGENAVWKFVHQMQDYVFEQTLGRLLEFRGELAETQVGVELILRHMSAAYVGVIHWWVEKGMPYSPAEMAEKLIALYRDGLYRSLGYKVQEDSFSL
jgi:AcrR family transcriptional regulator